MPKLTWTVKHNNTTDLPGIESMTITAGRRHTQDPFAPAVVTIVGTRPNLLPTIAIDDRITISTVLVSSPVVFFEGTVSDLTIEYGIVSNMDRWTMVCECAMAKLGRGLVSATIAADTGCVASCVSLVPSGVTLNAVGSGLSKSSAQTFTNVNPLETINKYATTEQGLLFGSTSALDTVNFWSRDNAVQQTITTTFSDAGGDVACYDSVVFGSLADRYATRVVTDPDGLTAQSNGTGIRTLTYATYDATVAQAADLAAYIRGALEYAAQVPSSISYTAEQQRFSNHVGVMTAVAARTGQTVRIVLRGNTYNCVTEGFTISVTPAMTRVTLHLSSFDFYAFFTLDDDVYGTLDNNRLGF